jgi:transketolase C-terminal domain/subunit
MAEVTGTTWNVYDANTLTQAEIYGRVLCELADKDERIVALTADLARSTKIGVFQDKFPDRVFNVGIAEQDLFGIAAGMAKSGLLPFVSTMSAFASRCAPTSVTRTSTSRSSPRTAASASGRPARRTTAPRTSPSSARSPTCA